MCVEMWRWAGSSWCFLPAVLEWRGAVLSQSSAQSVTAAAGMRLRTPRRRSDAFSQVRAAPGRPTTPTARRPLSLPPPPLSCPCVCQPSFRLFWHPTVAGCERLLWGAHRCGEKRLTPLPTFPAQLNLNQRTRSEVFLLPPSPPVQAFRTVTLALRGRDIRRWSYGRNAACIWALKLMRMRCASCLRTRSNQLKVKDCWWS